MGFFDNLKSKATDLAQAGVAQSKRLGEIAKLKANNMAEEDAIKKAYIELGKLYYAEKGMAPEGAYVSACEKITAAKAAIETNNQRIAELKEDGDEEDVVVPAAADVTETDFVDEVKEEVAEIVAEVKEDVAELVEEIKEEVKD